MTTPSKTTTQHTAGLERGYYTPTAVFRAIAEHVAVMRSDDQGLIAVCGPVGDPKSEADALMFAAAPDMLEALRMVLAWDEHAIGSKAREAIRAAIAKATGAAP